MTDEDWAVVQQASDRAIRALGKEIQHYPMGIGVPMLLAAAGVLVANIISGFAPDIEHADRMIDDHAKHVRGQVKEMMKEEIN